jgi:hypothetical protein
MESLGGASVRYIRRLAIMQAGAHLGRFTVEALRGAQANDLTCGSGWGVEADAMLTGLDAM